MVGFASLAVGLLASTAIAWPAASPTADDNFFPNNTDISAPYRRDMPQAPTKEYCESIVQKLNADLIKNTPACGENSTGHLTWDCGPTKQEYQEWQHNGRTYQALSKKWFPPAAFFGPFAALMLLSWDHQKVAVWDSSRCKGAPIGVDAKAHELHKHTCADWKRGPFTHATWKKPKSKDWYKMDHCCNVVFRDRECSRWAVAAFPVNEEDQCHGPFPEGHSVAAICKTNWHAKRPFKTEWWSDSYEEIVN